MSSFENARFYEVFVSVGFSCFRRLWLLGNVIQKTKGRRGQTKKTGFLLVSQLRFKVRLCLTEQTTVRFRICLMNRPLRSGHNEFAEDARGLVVLTHGLAVALQTISTKKSAFSYLQTCNINLVFFSLVYSSTNKGTTGKSYTSVAHGLHTSQLFLCPTEIWFVHKCRQFHCVNFSKECRWFKNK